MSASPRRNALLRIGAIATASVMDLMPGVGRAEHECFGFYPTLDIDLSQGDEFFLGTIGEYLRAEYGPMIVISGLPPALRITTAPGIPENSSTVKVAIDLQSGPSPPGVIDLIETFEAPVYETVESERAPVRAIVAKVARFRTHGETVGVMLRYRRRFRTSMLHAVVVSAMPGAAAGQALVASVATRSPSPYFGFCTQLRFHR